MTCVVHFFVAWFALALPDRHHPVSVHGAVDARELLTHGVIHAHTVDFPQGLVLTAGHGLREQRQALHRGQTGFVVDPDGEKCHARSYVLKGQVEAFSRQVLHHSRLSVDAQLVLAGDLVRSYGGHFLKLALPEGRAHVRVRLRREEVEGLLAGQGGPVEGVAVAHDELDLNEDPGGRGTPLDEGGAQPVVLLAFANVADGVGVELRAVQSPLDDLPLNKTTQTHKVRGRNTGPREPLSMRSPTRAVREAKIKQDHKLQPL